MSGSISTSHTWQPLGQVALDGTNVPVSYRPGSIPAGRRGGWNAARATSSSATARSVPTTLNLPSANFTSPSAASSRRAAIFWPLATTLSAAFHSAVPPITVEREPIVPMPQPTRSVSPSMYLTLWGSRPRRSCRICLNVVS